MQGVNFGKPGQAPAQVITFCLPEQFSLEFQLDIADLKPLRGLAVSGLRKGLIFDHSDKLTDIAHQQLILRSCRP